MELYSQVSVDGIVPFKARMTVIVLVFTSRMLHASATFCTGIAVY